MIYAILKYPTKEFNYWQEFAALPAHKEGYVLPQVIDSIPQYNSGSQYIKESTPIVESDKVRLTWEVINKSQSDINSETEQKWIDTTKSQILQSNIWNKMQNNTDLSNAEVQTVLRFIARLIVKAL